MTIFISIMLLFSPIRSHKVNHEEYIDRIYQSSDEKEDWGWRIIPKVDVDRRGNTYGSLQILKPFGDDNVFEIKVSKILQGRKKDGSLNFTASFNQLHG